MKIGIDARLYGPKHTGIGRYVQELVSELIPLSPQDQFIVFGDPKLLSELESFSNVTIVPLKTPIYSLAEQLINPFIFYSHHLDLLHVPHFNAPLLYFKKTIITVHDLIKHLSTGPDTTTLPSWQYRIKHLAYRFLISRNLKTSTAIITPSHYWKNYLITQLKVPSAKIFVTYEAVNAGLKPVDTPDKSLLKKYSLKKPYIIYTGNLYPHKNVNLLIKAVNSFNANHSLNLKLGIIAGRSAFHKRVTKSDAIIPLGYVPDHDLPHIYAQALALVQPSLIEGFGLTGLEAMKLKTPVVSSNATCLPEVYGQAALYFDPYDQQDLEEKLSWIVKEHDLRQRLIDRGQSHVTGFSWTKTARQTLKAYKYAFK